ncbi:sodium:proton antiporter [Paraphotobacterium marinum]|uniref:Sodium:proton antiporter n=1 Tax=Paraphotobacterium marinum TaxID=1755811 RepID=A0A220VHI3_9GAMM|nr:sodium:proton antiporter [Paraphotobacterium marinum]ASK79642.1 sodium:proton antiporter [Paraphotobacterium marinum]
MGYQILFSMLVIISALASFINSKYLKLPKSIGLTLTTLLISLVVLILLKIFPDWFLPVKDLLSGVDFKDIVLNTMLSYLLFAGSLHVNSIDLKQEFFPILKLASLGVVISTLITAILVHYISILLNFPISFPMCLVFGALISPTDPIAVLAVFKTTKSISQSTKTKIIGEALFNDAAGILLFIVLLGIVYSHDSVSLFSLSTTLIQQALGGLLLGFVLGKFVSFFLRMIDDKEVAILFTLALSSSGFILASAIDVSQAITMVIAGLVIGHDMKTKNFAKKTIVSLDSFWELVDEVLNSFLFVLIGLEMLTIDFNIKLICIGILSFIAIFIARYISVSSILINCITFFYNKNLSKKAYWKENLLMSWGGIRGGISIALALMIPENNSNSIITLTYVVVILSIVLQGSTFKWIVTKLYPKKES